MIGQTVSHYRILEKLGEGGMGVVYKAEDTKLKRAVALKFLPATASRDSVEKSRFIREAQAAAALDHPNIATVYEINESEEKSFIVMAYVEGVTLKDKTKSGPLAVDGAIDISIQINQGLKEAHDKGIIHRDIKSSNIMITPSGQVKISDFGLAKFKGGKTFTKPGDQIGTAGFMSPEQIQGKNVDHRSDIFSFGVVLYELLTGDLPFKGENDQAVMYSILYDEPPSITECHPEVPFELEHIVEKSLKKDVKERYQSSDNIIRDLLKIKRKLSDGDVTYAVGAGVKKKKRVTKSKFPIPKRPYIYGVIIVLLMLLIYAGVKIFTGNGMKIDSIAVLPFENLSKDPEQDYFVEGLHETLITDLTKIRSLKRIISRNSTMSYKQSNKVISEIARELDVDAILSGSVLHDRDSDKVRISVQLINGSTDEYMWADDYDRDLKNVLILLSEVARDIASKIKVELVPQEERRLFSRRPLYTEADEAYFKGEWFLNRFTVEGFQKSLKYFQKAIDIDPNLAKAWAGLAGAHILIAYYGTAPPGEAILQGKKAVSKALELDNENAWAHNVQGWIKLFGWDWPGAKKAFQKALELNPNDPLAWHGYGDYLTVTGHPEEGFDMVKRGRDYDPFSPISAVPVAAHLFMIHRYDESIAEANKLLEMDPRYPVHWWLARVFWQKGMYEEALSIYRKYLKPPLLDALDRGYRDSGPKGAMLAVAGKLVDDSNLEYVDPLIIAVWYAQTKEVDTTLEWLENACKNRSPALLYIKVVPDFDYLRPEPRFQEILRHMELLEYD